MKDGSQGMSRKPSDASAIPLCRCCHRMAPDSYHAIGNQTAWARLHNLNLRRLITRLRACYALLSGASIMPMSRKQRFYRNPVLMSQRLAELRKARA